MTGKLPASLSVLRPAEALRTVAVVGGGPAGMMAAGVAALRGHQVTLFEPQNTLGRKLRITGKGRCNLTNRCAPEDCLAQIRRNPRFMLSSLARFSPSDTQTFFEDLGLPLKIERGGRVFPDSDLAGDVADTLTEWLRTVGVTVRVARVTGIVKMQDTVTGLTLENGAFFPCKRVILSTGGLSYPKTGSTGDGYRMAEATGHTVVPPAPSLVPLISPDRFCAEMQGLSLRNVGFTLSQAGRKCYTGFGEMLFTHFGLSGPLVLSASAHFEPGRGEARVLIDLKPALDEKTLDRRILRDFAQYKNRDLRNALSDLLHQKMIPVIISMLSIPPETKVHSVTAGARRALGALIKAFPIRVTGTRPIAEAIVTAGGVSVKEVDPATMASRLCSGLFFAGELLDVDAYTGGYNLQICWSTGFAAGCGV